MKFTFALACCLFVCAVGRAKADKDCESEMDELKRELEEQKKTIAFLKNELADQKGATKTLEINMETMSRNMEIIDNKHEAQFNELKGYISNGPRNVQHLEKQSPNGAYQAHGCVGENIELSCTNNRTIFVTQAIYGQYGPDYSQPNCAPHPYDCYESMSATDEDQWLYIKYLCDNQTACSYPFGGTVFITDCAPGSLVDYINIQYDCLPEPTYEAVGFTAYAPDDYSYYDGNDIVIFDSTVTNIGGYYQTTSIQFLCPADGMYAFSLNVLVGSGYQFYGAIMKESIVLDSVFGDHMSGFEGSASNFVITICSKGERVWVRCLSDGDAVSDNDYHYNTFSGFLLQRL